MFPRSNVMTGAHSKQRRARRRISSPHNTISDITIDAHSKHPWGWPPGTFEAPTSAWPGARSACEPRSRTSEELGLQPHRLAGWRV